MSETTRLLRQRILEWRAASIEGHGLWARYQDARELLAEVLDLIPDECPECGGRIKGYVANAIRKCGNDWHFTPDPGVDLDDDDGHVVELGETGWAIQHPLACRPNLLDCPTHRAVDTFMDARVGPPVDPGRYVVVVGAGGGVKFVRLAGRGTP